MGITAVKSHEQGKGHRQKIKLKKDAAGSTLTNFFQKMRNPVGLGAAVAAEAAPIEVPDPVPRETLVAPEPKKEK